MEHGCYTALVTPFSLDGTQLDIESLNRLVSFQIENSVNGIVSAGTTGECSTLTWKEHNVVIDNVIKIAKSNSLCIAGTGSNNTLEAIEATREAVNLGVDGVLLVDPYYNGPSSVEIRKEYYAPIAETFPNIDLIPYIVPGRTGTKLDPEDLAILNKNYPNIHSVKEATGDLNNMKKIRELCEPSFSILSGDDSIFFDIMNDPIIKASGVISVISNVVPKTITEICEKLKSGDSDGAKKLKAKIEPLFDLVTVTTQEETSFGKVNCRARNPLPIKTFMALLGMPVGPCRAPFGKMTKNGMEFLLSVGRKLHLKSPEIFQPIEDFFKIDIEERLYNPVYQKTLFYNTYI